MAITFEFYQMPQEPMMKRSFRIAASAFALSAAFAGGLCWLHPNVSGGENIKVFVAAQSISVTTGPGHPARRVAIHRRRPEAPAFDDKIATDKISSFEALFTLPLY